MERTWPYSVNVNEYSYKNSLSYTFDIVKRKKAVEILKTIFPSIEHLNHGYRVYFKTKEHADLFELLLG